MPKVVSKERNTQKKTKEHKKRAAPTQDNAETANTSTDAPLSMRPKRITIPTRKAAAALEQLGTPTRQALPGSTLSTSRAPESGHAPASQGRPQPPQVPEPRRPSQNPLPQLTIFTASGTGGGSGLTGGSVTTGSTGRPGGIPSPDPSTLAQGSTPSEPSDGEQNVVDDGAGHKDDPAAGIERSDSPSPTPPPKKRSKKTTSSAAEEAVIELPEKCRNKREKKSKEQKEEAWERLAESDAQVAQAMETLWSTVESAIETAADSCGKTESFFMLKLGLYGREMATTRAPNVKNVFISVSIKELNDTLPKGEKTRWDMRSFMEIWGLDKYEKLTDEQKEELLVKLETLRQEKRAPSIRKTNCAALDDVNATLKKIYEMADRLYIRTGQQTLILSTKTKHESYVRPQYHIMQEAEGFVDAFLKLDMATLLHHLEGWTVDGTEGVVKSARTVQEETKRQIMSYILKNLRSVSGKMEATMKYTNFDHHVMARYKGDLVGWPLKTFKNPSKMNKNELRAVSDALSSDPPRLFFEKLTNAEVKELLKKRQL